MSDANACGCQGRLRCGYHEGFEDGKATLAKRVEELENQRDEADDALAFVRNERDRALKRVEELERVADRYNLLLQQDLEIKYPRALAVVEAARKYVNDAGADIMELADALAAFDKEE